MRTVGIVEAQDQLAPLLDRVEHGETITITRHGKPVARLVPAGEIVTGVDVADAIAAMAEFQERGGPTLGGEIIVRDLVEEGRH